ncbi:FACT complex subunit SSRP1-like, partial [Curcuma longa]|uniref:FACT complex subunit SSRP1-like n=1 Tax=Curcuma longa TaxID=136217 RepID=UPI003D9EAD20
MTDGQLYSNILLGGRGGTNPGQLKVHPGGIAWRKQGGGKIIEIEKADISRVTWMKVPRAFQLGVRLKDGLFYKFIGFREQDVSNLTNYIQKNIGVAAEEKQLSTNGHNWGEIDINDFNNVTLLSRSNQWTIDEAVDKSAPLPFKIPGECEVIGDAIGTHVAWPQDLIVMKDE